MNAINQVWTEQFVSVQFVNLFTLIWLLVVFRYGSLIFHPKAKPGRHVIIIGVILSVWTIGVIAANWTRLHRVFSSKRVVNVTITSRVDGYESHATLKYCLPTKSRHVTRTIRCAEFPDALITVFAEKDWKYGQIVTLNLYSSGGKVFDVTAKDPR